MRAKSLRCAEGKRESMKPVIGIIAACTREVHPAYTTGHDYVRAVERAGGLAVLLPATPDAVSAGMAQWLALCGGFVLPGGGDVAPTYYGQSPVPQLTSTDRLRDNVELTLCRAAAQHKKPLLGICRGAQVLNVAFGGTLWQDIPAQCRAAICHYQDSAARGELFHSLTLAPDSLLARIMGPGQHECNTFHHQAVRDVAPGFAAAAHAPDGLVEAVESADGLALGVQWHPENLAPEHPDHAAIFTWLVDAAAGGALLKR